MQRPQPIITGETYHVFNRGAHKSLLFRTKQDYQHFLALLYLCNSKQSLRMRQYRGRPSADPVNIFREERVEKSLVDVLAYCLMPNHFHLVLRQKTDHGIAAYMKKIGTGYSMYFNAKYEHSGTMFQGRYKSVLASDEAYLRWLFSYVHLNPVALSEPHWQEKGIRASEKLRNFLHRYQYSSYYDYRVLERPETIILNTEEARIILADSDDLEDMLSVYAKDRPR